MGRRLVVAAVLAVAMCATVAWANLCEDCKTKRFTNDVGKCTQCGRNTRSSAFQLCRECSSKLGKCEHCLAATASPPVDKTDAPPSAGPGKTEPATSIDERNRFDPKRSGGYRSGKWEYRYDITAVGKQQGRFGWLIYNGENAPTGSVNDYHETPWGRLYWVGVPEKTAADHGWMPTPVEGTVVGRRLATPAVDTPQQEFTDGDDGKKVSLPVGQVFAVRLSGNPTTGYRWRLGQVEGDAVTAIGEPRYAPTATKPGVDGSGGHFIFTFRTAAPGKAKVTLHYARPWEKTDPAKSFILDVTVTAAAHPAKGSHSGAR